MSELEVVVAKARSDCAQLGQRLTEKREKILRVLLASEAPLSAYDILDQYRAIYGESMPAMSVYRMLQFLEDSQLVHKLETTNQYLPCIHIRCDHEHSAAQFLICDNCQHVQEIALSDSVVKELTDCVKENGFKLTNSQLELHGLCETCAAAKPN